MSNFSGKCDLADTVMIYGVENILSKYKIYAYNQILPLEIKEPKDLIPYYPYLVGSMASNKETGGVIRLSSESFIDMEERDHMKWELNAVLRYWRRCKRKKEEFDEQEALSCIVWPSDMTPRDYQIEIVRRVKEQGAKASVDGLHDSMHDRYRKDLFDEMISNGWNEDDTGIWVYGWLRWIDMKERKNNILTS